FVAETGRLWLRSRVPSPWRTELSVLRVCWFLGLSRLQLPVERTGHLGFAVSVGVAAGDVAVVLCIVAVIVRYTWCRIAALRRGSKRYAQLLRDITRTR